MAKKKRSTKKSTSKAGNRDASGSPSSYPKRAPIDCTFDQICQLDRDNQNFGDYWVCIDGIEVTIAEQVEGEKPKQIVSIPVPIMRRIIRFLTTPRRSG